MPRSYKNVFINSRLQGLHLGHAIGAYLIGCAAMGFAFFITYGVVLDRFAKGDSLLQMQYAELIMKTGLPLMFGFCVMFGLFVVVPFSLFLSHKTAGPIVAIKRYIRSLKEGNYNDSIELRDGDELKEIASDLEDFAKKMKQAA